MSAPISNQPTNPQHTTQHNTTQHTMIILLLILLLLFIIAMKICDKGHKRATTSTDCKDIGLSRMVWGIVLIPLGIAFPPLLIVSFFLILYALAFYKKAK